MTYWSWWPAMVLLPGDRPRRTLHTCRVYATDLGLYVYRRKPVASVEPEFFSPIDYAATSRPASMLPSVASDIHTEAGLVIVTSTGGCGCGNPMKSWRPAFSSRIAAWPA